MHQTQNTHTKKEEVIYTFRPSRIYFIGEYLLFVFMMILTATSLYSTMITRLQKYDILASITVILFYLLLMISVILLVKVEYKIWLKKYTLTTHGITSSKGIFTEVLTSATYNKITDIGLKQSFFDKIMNTGTIYVDTAGTDKIELVFENVNRPFFIKQKISELQTTSIPEPVTRRK